MSTRSDVTDGAVVDVGATSLYREVRGDGLQPPAGWTATSMAEQADDAAALLRALGLAPAVVVGHSGGGSIACELVVRHPDVVRHAVIYEAALSAVVREREQMAAGMRGVTDHAMAEGGTRHAMEMFMRANAGDEVVDHFAASDPAQIERVLGNGVVFIPIELPTFAAFVPDLSRMRAGGAAERRRRGREPRHLVGSSVALARRRNGGRRRPGHGLSPTPSSRTTRACTATSSTATTSTASPTPSPRTPSDA
ncbi:MAG: alpha/beta fold hydrolase [Pseudonocardiaceae bacterium]|nr:alpha/beta fold hydrolase [Pseudonocardiaceae bacterium]